MLLSQSQRRPTRKPAFTIPWHVPILLAASSWLSSCSRTEAPPPVALAGGLQRSRHPTAVLLKTELPGRTAPFRIAEIRPQVNGLMTQKRLFTEGVDVKEGQELYQIDPAHFRRRSTMPRPRAASGGQLARHSGESEPLHKRPWADKAVSQQDFDECLRRSETGRG